MTGSSWIGLNEAEVRVRLARRLGIAINTGIQVGFGGRSDGTAYAGGQSWVLVEIEHTQTHPEGNMLKYWPGLERSRRRVVLIHAIAPDARKHRGARTDLTRWLAARMERNLRGRFVDCRIELGSDHEKPHFDEAKAAIAKLRDVAPEA